MAEPGYSEMHAAFSPDGRWLAYCSDESGRREIYVRPFPDVEARRWQVSSDGGEQPLWALDGTRIYYRQRSEPGFMMVAPIAIRDGAPLPGPAKALFPDDYANRVGRNYDLSPDGERFLMLRTVSQDDAESTPLIVVTNWLQELERLVPTK